MNTDSPLTVHEEHGYNTLRDTIEFFILENGPILSRRLQVLLFYTDYQHTLEHGEPLTNASYSPYMYGFYSQTIDEQLAKIDTNTKRVIRNGERTVVHSLDLGSYPTTDVNFLEEIQAQTEDVPVTVLAQYAKDTELFENTEYRGSADFSTVTNST